MQSKKITQIFPYLLPGKDLRNFQGTFKKSLEDSNAATFVCDTLAEESIGETRNTTHMFKKLSDLLKPNNRYSFLIISDGKFNFEPFKFPLRSVDIPFNATVLHIVDKPDKVDADISFPSYCYAMFSRLKFDHQYIMEDIPTGLVSKKSNAWTMNKHTESIFARVYEDTSTSTGVRFSKDKKEKEGFDDFIKTICSTETKYVAPVIKFVLVYVLYV
jgi:hypothetical protein